jgi:secreted trypsin-like serine protease
MLLQSNVCKVNIFHINLSSGGPLQIKDKEVPCLYYIVGVTSLGLDCGQNIPGLYTNVSFHLDWIERNVWPDEI